MAVEIGTVSHCFTLVIRKFIDFMSFFRYSVCVFFFLLNIFALHSLESYILSSTIKTIAFSL